MFMFNMIVQCFLIEKFLYSVPHQHGYFEEENDDDFIAPHNQVEILPLDNWGETCQFVISFGELYILEEINRPKYDKLQKLIVENAVYYEFADGTMGIRGPWVAPDPREVPLE